ncbi:hypothetical protein D3C78_1754320 [compost metagenome]
MHAQGDPLPPGGVSLLALLGVGHDRVEALQRRFPGAGKGGKNGEKQGENPHRGHSFVVDA